MIYQAQIPENVS